MFFYDWAHHQQKHNKWRRREHCYFAILFTHIGHLSGNSEEKTISERSIKFVYNFQHNTFTQTLYLCENVRTFGNRKRIRFITNLHNTIRTGAKELSLLLYIEYTSNEWRRQVNGCVFLVYCVMLNCPFRLTCRKMKMEYDAFILYTYVTNTLCHVNVVYFGSVPF